jgi:hypothetical protein
MPGWCVLTNSFARANPLIGLTGEEYKDFACALVSYVAFHATVDQATYFMDLCRDYTGEIAGKVAVAGRVRRPLVPVLPKGERAGAPDTAMRSAFKKLRSH